MQPAKQIERAINNCFHYILSKKKWWHFGNAATSFLYNKIKWPAKQNVDKMVKRIACKSFTCLLLRFFCVTFVGRRNEWRWCENVDKNQVPKSACLVLLLTSSSSTRMNLTVRLWSHCYTHSYVFLGTYCALATHHSTIFNWVSEWMN